MNQDWKTQMLIDLIKFLVNSTNEMAYVEVFEYGVLESNIIKLTLFRDKSVGIHCCGGYSDHIAIPNEICMKYEQNIDEWFDSEQHRFEEIADDAIWFSVLLLTPYQVSCVNSYSKKMRAIVDL